MKRERKHKLTESKENLKAMVSLFNLIQNYMMMLRAQIIKKLMFCLNNMAKFQSKEYLKPHQLPKM
jgi:hypothetical protein